MIKKFFENVKGDKEFEQFFWYDIECFDDEIFAKVTTMFSFDELRYINGIVDDVPDIEHYKRALMLYAETQIVEFYKENDGYHLAKLLRDYDFSDSEINFLIENTLSQYIDEDGNLG